MAGRSVDRGRRGFGWRPGGKALVAVWVFVAGCAFGLLACSPQARTLSGGPPSPTGTSEGVTMPALVINGPAAVPPAVGAAATTTTAAHAAAQAADKAAAPAPVMAPAVATTRAPAVATTTAPADAAAGSCASVIAEVEGRGLFPAPGFQVVCPGDALGHMGYTCLNNLTVCPGARRIVVHYIAAFVVANEFENSWILSNEGSRRCRVIDCGHIAYGF